MAKIYVHPNNPDGQIRVGEGYAWWALIFGVFWFWAKGMIARGLFWMFLGFLTFGFAWFFAPIWAFRDYEKHLIERGYKLGK